MVISIYRYIDSKKYVVIQFDLTKNSIYFIFFLLAIIIYYTKIVLFTVIFAIIIVIIFWAKYKDIIFKFGISIKNKLKNR